ncbi:hypothetical protein B0H12DRAFT_1078582 [Mycena haematopus]|nr:hypothetical protein B0H12DRAFT_1078582 [Mycena haematopus]
MSPTSVPELAREFGICVSLSVFVVLGGIHGLRHLLHACIASGFAFCLPIAKFLAPPAAQLVQILYIRAYLVVVFKLIVACTVLVFALREIVSGVGSWTGWWDMVEVQGVLEAVTGGRKIGARDASLSADEEKRSAFFFTIIAHILTSDCQFSKPPISQQHSHFLRDLDIKKSTPLIQAIVVHAIMIFPLFLSQSLSLLAIPRPPASYV